MKPIKKKIIFAIASIVLLLLIILFASTEADAAMEYPLKIFMENREGKLITYSLEDSNTGVCYIVVVAESSVGDLNRSVTICPRYNENGTLYTVPYYQSKALHD